MLIALDRGDIAKLPFSDDVTPDSRLLMRRNLRERVAALAPFLTFDPDPYIVVGDDGRLSWIMDAFTTSDSYPYSTPLPPRRRIHQLHPQQRQGRHRRLQRHDDLLRVRPDDPIIAAYRRIFPGLFKDAAAMPPDLRKHVRYPELLLKLQAAVYGLYHMTDPEVFYNREDLWTRGHGSRHGRRRRATTQPMQPNFVLMKLPGETGAEFVEILPFTPANRNNLIGWIAGRSDGEQLWHVDRLRLPQDQAGRRPAADRGAHRSERATVRTIDPVESARLARPPRSSARHSDRPRAVVRRTHLPAGRAQPDAGVAPGRACGTGPPRLWTNIRIRDGGSFWRSRLVHDCGARFRGAGAKAGVNFVIPAARRGFPRANRRSRQRPIRLPAPDIRR